MELDPSPKAASSGTANDLIWLVQMYSLLDQHARRALMDGAALELATRGLPNAGRQWWHDRAPDARAVTWLSELDGIDDHAALTRLVELGGDRSHWPRINVALIRACRNADTVGQQVRIDEIVLLLRMYGSLLEHSAAGSCLLANAAFALAKRRVSEYNVNAAEATTTEDWLEVAAQHSRPNWPMIEEAEKYGESQRGVREFVFVDGATPMVLGGWEDDLESARCLYQGYMDWRRDNFWASNFARDVDQYLDLEPVPSDSSYKDDEESVKLDRRAWENERDRQRIVAIAETLALWRDQFYQDLLEGRDPELSYRWKWPDDYGIYRDLYPD